MKRIKGMDEDENAEHRNEHRAVVPDDLRRDRRKYLLPKELANRVFEACHAGVPETQIAKALGINYRTWMRVREEDGRVSSALAEARSSRTQSRSLTDKERKLRAAVCLGLRHLGEPRRAWHVFRLPNGIPVGFNQIGRTRAYAHARARA